MIRPGPLDGDAVGDRRLGGHRERRAGGERRREGRARRDLDADHADLGPRELDRAGDARDQAAAADRHDHRREIGNLRRAARAPSVAWPMITSGSSKGCTKTAPVSARALARRGDAVVDGLAAERDEAAVALHGRDLRDRRLGRHEDLAGDAARAGRVGQRLRVVARAPGDHARGVADVRRARLSAPRSLNEPVRCRFSALSRMRAPKRSLSVPETSTGVSRARSRTISSAATAAPACEALRRPRRRRVRARSRRRQQLLRVPARAGVALVGARASARARRRRRRGPGA